MRIGIFGGSFNPPHVGHLIIAEMMREAFDLHRVLWIPSADPPHKDVRDLAPAADRLEMVRLAISGNDAFELSEIEFARSGKSFTIDTILELKRRRPNDEFFLIVGGDSLADFHRWRDPDRILEEVSLIVYDRPGAGEPVAVPQERILRVETPQIDVSSTEIRRRCSTGQSVRYLLPPAVEEYVRRNDLYRK